MHRRSWSPLLCQKLRCAFKSCYFLVSAVGSNSLWNIGGLAIRIINAIPVFSRISRPPNIQEKGFQYFVGAVVNPTVLIFKMLSELSWHTRSRDKTIFLVLAPCISEVSLTGVSKSIRIKKSLLRGLVNRKSTFRITRHIMHYKKRCRCAGRISGCDIGFSKSRSKLWVVSGLIGT